jgi:hypothetical protein
MNMGRKRKHNTDMPARVYLSRGWWFFTPKGSPKIKLAGEQDRAGALRAYAELMDGRPRSGTVAELLNRYARDVLPGKSVRTRKEQERQIHKINAVFGTMRIPDITPPMIAQYLDANPAKVAANREMALLSHAYTKAIRWGLASVNPCRGVERNTERPRDLLRLRRDAITADGLQVQQRKTGKRLLIHWTPALRWAIEQAGTLPAEGRASLWIVAQRDGSPYSESGFQTAWQKHIRKCHEQGVIAERFTFHDLRAKAGSDVKDGRLLGHMDPRTLRRVYLRKPEKVSPVN